MAMDSIQAGVDKLTAHEADLERIYMELRDLLGDEINDLPAPVFRAYVNARKAVMRAEIEMRVLREQLDSGPPKARN